MKHTFLSQDVFQVLSREMFVYVDSCKIDAVFTR